MTMLWIAVAVLVVLACAVAWALYRRRPSWWITRIAAQLGLERKPRESDTELRARCRAVMSTPAHATESGVRKIANEAARKYGHRAELTVDAAHGLVRVHVVCLRPDSRLTPIAVQAVETGLLDYLPAFMALEVTS